MKLYLVEKDCDVGQIKKTKDTIIIRVSDILLEHNYDYNTLDHAQIFIIQEDLKNKLKRVNNLKRCDNVFLFVDKIHKSFIQFIQDYILEQKIRFNDFQIIRQRDA